MTRKSGKGSAVVDSSSSGAPGVSSSSSSSSRSWARSEQDMSPHNRIRPPVTGRDAHIYFHYLYNDDNDAKLAGRIRNRANGPSGPSQLPSASLVQASRWALCPFCGFRAFSNRHHGTLRLTNARNPLSGEECGQDVPESDRWTDSTCVTVATLMAHLTTCHPSLRCDFIQCSASLSLHVVVQKLQPDSEAEGVDKEGTSQGSGSLKSRKPFASCDAWCYRNLEAAPGSSDEATSIFVRNKWHDAHAALTCAAQLAFMLASVGAQWPPNILQISKSSSGGHILNRKTSATPGPLAGSGAPKALPHAALSSSPLLQRRFFHRSGVAYALAPGASGGRSGDTVVNYDSENEESDITSGIIEDAQLTEFNDVTMEEKAFMSLWNVHARKFPTYSQCYLPYVCEVFARRYCSFIVKKHLRMSFLVFLLHLWSLALLRAEEVASVIGIVDREMAREISVSGSVTR